MSTVFHEDFEKDNCKIGLSNDVDVYDIPGIMNIRLNKDLNTIIVTWFNYHIVQSDLKHAVIDVALNYAVAHNVKFWIADSTNAEGVFSKDCHKYIDNCIFSAFAENGIKYFITLTSEVSALTRLTVKTYSDYTARNGLKLMKFNNLDDALLWIEKQ